MAYTGKVICWIHNKSLELNLKAREVISISSAPRWSRSLLVSAALPAPSVTPMAESGSAGKAQA